jgi:hypothetical protein
VQFYLYNVIKRLSNRWRSWPTMYLQFIHKLHYKISQFYRQKNSVGVWLEVRRWFFYRRHHRRITSIGFSFVGDSPFRRYIGRKNKKTICRWFYRQNLRAKKKRFPLEIYRRIFSPSVYCDWPTENNRR